MPLPIEDLRQMFAGQGRIMTAEEFAAAEKKAADAGVPLEKVIAEEHLVSRQYFLDLLSEHFGIPAIDLKMSAIDKSTLALLPEKFVAEHLSLPFAIEEGQLCVGFADPRNAGTVTEIERMTNMPVKSFVALENAIRRGLILYQGTTQDIVGRALSNFQIYTDDSEADLKYNEQSGVGLFESLLDLAQTFEVSDIHLEPYETDFVVRFRIDGFLREIAVLPISVYQRFISYLKVLASLELDERRTPQEGRIRIKKDEQPIDLRISLAPTMWGEKAVLRVLLKDNVILNLAHIGLLEQDYALIQEYIAKPFGMILITGPTGSGKTTTLYTFLQEIGSKSASVLNISTIEDPIEYTMPRITQMQINPGVEFTFPAGLRAILRQDPDIVMVGEIRDGETASTAVRASLTGRPLFSSLHTNNAIGTIPRLLDMGVEPYLVASTLRLVIAQRLVRKLCPHCREQYYPEGKALENMRSFTDETYAIRVLKDYGIIPEQISSFGEIPLFKEKGCSRCDFTGYSGRVGIFEVLEMNDRVRQATTTGKDDAAFKKILEDDGFKTLGIDGLAKAILGTTNIDEVFRVTW
ncbi:MAG: type II/IV secretion system protein [Candidatus Moranbacteria bacterium]|nr:type II/IV secretion system protein [Candidatus Moranbacteria bacterium]